MRIFTLIFIFLFALSFIGGITSIQFLSDQSAVADHHEAQTEGEETVETPEPETDEPEGELPGGDMPDEAAGDDSPTE